MNVTLLMMKEEFRMHASYSTPWMFLAFPFVVLGFSFGIAVTSRALMAYTPLEQMLLLLHASVFLYGLSVGAFGFLGKVYLERQYGTRNYLVTTPSLLPLSFRRAFLAMFFRDVAFYLLLLLVPMAAGLYLSIPFTGFHPLSITLLFAATLLTFLIGISLSFAMSVLFVRSLPAFVAASAVVAAVFAAQGVFRALPDGAVMPALALQYQLPPFATGNLGDLLALTAAGIALFVLFTAAAVLLVTDTYESRGGTFEPALPRAVARFARLRDRGTLVAKELVDIRRSHTVPKLFFSFAAPLLFLAFTAWFVRYGLQVPVGFNAVFYGAMVGFFGVMIYNWLTNVDVADYFNTLPVTVPQVIKAKLLAFLLLTAGISTAFVVGVSVVNGDTALLWLALPVMAVVSVYMVVLVAFLTGLRTTSFFFDPAVMLSFTALSMLPDVAITILSFTIDKDFGFALAGLTLAMMALVTATWFLYRGIDVKWGRAEFVD